MQNKAKLVLDQMYSQSSVYINSELIELDKITRVSPEQGDLLYKIASEPNVNKSLEIGFAYGFSTVYILEALATKKNATHFAIDPFEHSCWKSVGLKIVEHLEYKNFKWINDYSIHSLSRFIYNKSQFDLIFIDGNHRFDDILVDFYLSDQVLNEGGYLILDDMWMPSTQAVDRFILSNRSYIKIEQPVINAAVYKKISHDSRDWNHFVDFF